MIRRVVHRPPPPVPTSASVSVYVGLMSGTSLDGISAAVVRFVATTTGTHRARAPRLRRHRLHARRNATASLRALDERHRAASTAASASTSAGGSPTPPIAVLAEPAFPRRDRARSASHGQTVWHDAPHSTWQLGEVGGDRRANGHRRRERFPRARRRRGRAGRAARSDRRCACSFRGDRVARAAEHRRHRQRHDRSAAAADSSGVRAFDTGPGVAVIDAVTRALVPGESFDVDGALAARGTPIDARRRRAPRASVLRSPSRRSRPDASCSTAPTSTALIARCRAQQPDVLRTRTSSRRRRSSPRAASPTRIAASCPSR